MPIYGFMCSKCSYGFEQHLSIDERDIPTAQSCPRCNHYTVSRVPGYGGFRLKGFCWSRDNYTRTLGDDPRGSQYHNEDYE